METGPARDFAAVREGVTGWQVENRLVDFLQSPVGLERQHSTIAHPLQGLQMLAPLYFANANWRADGDERAGGRRRAAHRILEMDMGQPRAESRKVVRRRRRGVRHVPNIARVQD